MQHIFMGFILFLIKFLLYFEQPHVLSIKIFIDFKLKSLDMNKSSHGVHTFGRVINFLNTQITGFNALKYANDLFESGGVRKRKCVCIRRKHTRAFK